MRPAPELLLPQERHRPWAVLGGSIVLHLALLAALLFYGRVPSMVTPPGQVRLVELPRPGTPVTRTRASRRATVRAPQEVVATRVPRVVAADNPVGLPGESAGPGAPAEQPQADRYGRIGPALATGRVWMPPLPLPPRELATRLSRSHSELADSAVTAIIQAFLDSIATDPATRAVRAPDWTTTLGGAKFGLDARWIYLAGLKIPTALLALLPIPVRGNDQKAFDRSDALYRDLRQAAQRAANVAEFKQAIKDIRERKEAERQFEQNQHTPPPPDIAPEDPPK